MKPPPFRYHDPTTVPEVVGLLASLDNAKLLAGGQSLMPMLNMRYVLPDHLVDLARVADLAGIRETRAGMEVGAMTRQRDLEFSDLVRRRFPLVHEALLCIGHRQTRNRGTIGGSLCHLDPSAELVCCAMTLDATVRVAGPDGEREIAFADFPVAYMMPAIEPTELVTAIRFDAWPDNHGAAFIEFARRHGDFALVSSAVMLQRDGAGKIARTALTIGGMGTVPVRAHEAERILTSQTPGAALFREAAEACRNIAAIDDIHAPARYRQHLAAVLTERALAKAHERIGRAVA
jgi:carbon-monoxide dehydrogenase medium subunit